MKLIPLKRVDLKAHPQLNEAWLQDQIAEDPSILGLGEPELKDRERDNRVGVGWIFYFRMKNSALKWNSNWEPRMRPITIRELDRLGTPIFVSGRLG